MEIVRLNSNTLLKDKLWFSLYEISFPAEERESKEVICKTADNKNGIVLALKEGNAIIGLVTCQFLPTVSLLFIVYLAIASEYQNMQFGEKIFNYLKSISDKMINQKIQGLWEIDKPYENGISGNEFTKRKRRESFFIKNGGKIINTDYVQPPVDGNTFVNMNLMYFPRTTPN